MGLLGKAGGARIRKVLSRWGGRALFQEAQEGFAGFAADLLGFFGGGAEGFGDLAGVFGGGAEGFRGNVAFFQGVAVVFGGAASFLGVDAAHFVQGAQVFFGLTLGFFGAAQGFFGAAGVFFVLARVFFKSALAFVDFALDFVVFALRFGGLAVLFAGRRFGGRCHGFPSFSGAGNRVRRSDNTRKRVFCAALLFWGDCADRGKYVPRMGRGASHELRMASALRVRFEALRANAEGAQARSDNVTAVTLRRIRKECAMAQFQSPHFNVVKRGKLAAWSFRAARLA